MTTSTVNSEISVEDRKGTGELAREPMPLSSQSDWEPTAGRPDPVELLIEQNTTREADLVPVRHGRMTVSPFIFYRRRGEGDGERSRHHADGRPCGAAVRRRGGKGEGRGGRGEGGGEEAESEERGKGRGGMKGRGGGARRGRG